MPQDRLDEILAGLGSKEPPKRAESAQKAVKIAESDGLSVDVRLALLDRLNDRDIALDSHGNAGKRVRDIALEALVADTQMLCSKDGVVETLGSLTGKTSHAVLRDMDVADPTFIGYDRIREHAGSRLPELDRTYQERYPDALLDGMLSLLKDSEPGIRRGAAAYFYNLAGSRMLGSRLEALAPYLSALRSR
ncbi:MAG: hypothetical protein V1875_10565 [Candidatus Altiarchaeota archaeon]